MFTLRTHASCASNLLILFERVDKAAVELFIVHKRERRTREGKQSQHRDYRVALFSPLHLDGLSSSRISFSLAISFLIFHLSSSRSFYILLQSRACNDNISLAGLEDTRPRVAYLRERQSDCLKIVKPDREKNRTGWFPRITKSLSKQ